jgi:hypothetical protein
MSDSGAGEDDVGLPKATVYKLISGEPYLYLLSAESVSCSFCYITMTLHRLDHQCLWSLARHGTR